MKYFESDCQFNSEFDTIQGLKEYPFVGMKYSKSRMRLLVYGDNAAVKDLSKELHLKTRISNSMDGFVFTMNEPWNKAFRNFVSMSTGQSKTFKENSEDIQQIIEFVSSLSFVNFINGVVESPSPKRVKIINPKVHLEINSRLIDILNPTHIVCWGESPYSRLKKIESLQVLNQSSIVFERNKKGFAIAELLNKRTAQKIRVLKIHHPGWDKVGPYRPETHFIMKAFYSSN